MLQSIDDTAQLTLHPLGTRLAVCYPLLVQKGEDSHRSRYVWLTQLFPVEAVPPPWQQAFEVLAHAATGSNNPLPAHQSGEPPALITCRVPQALQPAAEGQQVRTAAQHSLVGSAPVLPQLSSAQLQQAEVLVIGLMQWGFPTHCLRQILHLGSPDGTPLGLQASPPWCQSQPLRLLCPAGTGKLPAAARRHLVD